jgi:uncharacterized protein (TIGR03086 family)
MTIREGGGRVCAMFDISPATEQLASLLRGVGDEQLAGPTPCPRYSLGDLIDHVNGLSLAFTRAAAKSFPTGRSQPPSADASRLGPDWRTRIPNQLTRLAEAWRDPSAWEGMTEAGGVDLPAQVAAMVVLNEVVVHGWDVSRASGQPFRADPQVLAICGEFLGQATERSGDAFGPVVGVPADAPDLDRVIGLSGRDPSWTPGP